MPDPSPPAALTLYVPRAIPAVVLGLAAVWTIPLVAALVTARPVGVGSQVLNGVIALGLLAFGVDTALIRVHLTASTVSVRRLLRTRELGWVEVKGVALLQDGGVPHLRLVTTGDPVEVPAWSLRGRHADGEVEPAADALPRFATAHGIKLRVRTLAGPPG